MSTTTTDTAETTDALEESVDDATTEPSADEKLAALESASAAAKKVNRDLERKLKANQAELDALKAAAAKKPEGDALDAETIKAEARKEALAEASVKANERLVRAEVKAAAGTKLADPADAVRLLDLADFDVDEDGNVDEKAIASAIDDLLKKKPYLAAQGGKRFQGSGDGGARDGSDVRSDLHAQIAQATKSGNHQLAIRLRQELAASLKPQN